MAGATVVKRDGARVEFDVAKIVSAIARAGAAAGEFDVGDAAEAARAVRSAFMPFSHPILIEHCVQHEDTEASLRDQIRFILKALGKSG